MLLNHTHRKSAAEGQFLSANARCYAGGGRVEKKSEVKVSMTMNGVTYSATGRPPTHCTAECERSIGRMD